MTKKELIQAEKKAFKEFINNTPLAGNTEYNAWHLGWDAALEALQVAEPVPTFQFYVCDNCGTWRKPNIPICPECKL